MSKRRYGLQTMWQWEDSFYCKGFVPPDEFVAHVLEVYGYTLDASRVKHCWYYTGPPFDFDSDWGLYPARDGAPGAGRYTEAWL